LSFERSSRLTGEDGGLDIDADNDITPESPGTQLLAELDVAIHTPRETSIAVDLDQSILRRADDTAVDDEMSVSSELSDLQLTEDPFLDSEGSTGECIQVDVPRLLRSGTKLKRPPAKSPYFTPVASPSRKIKAKVAKSETANTSPSKKSPSKRPPGTISCIPFPPLSAPHFGLIQEKLAYDPFRLLIAVTFLNRTHGKHAIPVFYNLMEQYPTPESLVDAPKEDIVSVIRHLGLQNQRAATYQAYAKTFIENPPINGKRYAVHDYPTKGQGRDVKKSEVLPDESSDPRPAWEIGHITQGPYALDSWRIFCRDILRGKAKGWNGEGSEEEGFQPEWMRVLPEDKELRAFLRWMWLKEGFEWDPFTGEKEVAGEELMRAALEGRIAWDDAGGMRILDGLVDPDTGEAAYWSGEGSLVWREDLNI
jgi:methyl-CpG-binding domain protein 4